ncbi:hypothetical protein PNIG_b0624 [Pseudoalteromonas nigrifaciens]|uniref:Uncharacterized protein n=1 Tax=Pseudoalteromonas nigrifaciens TaxID=28109 RepID=A0AAC9XZG0_9GAMM|nr:hypothetical protein PNIG_b0624 [Pseudoalteromonas nigrifaciens]
MPSQNLSLCIFEELATANCIFCLKSYKMRKIKIIIGKIQRVELTKT